jgi:hypothetical protein
MISQPCRFLPAESGPIHIGQGLGEQHSRLDGKAKRKISTSSGNDTQILRILLSITNKMQRYTIFFIILNALRVSGGFFAHHQELKTLHTFACCIMWRGMSTYRMNE